MPSGEDAPHVSDVLLIHADEEIKVNIILRRDLPRGVTGTWDAVLGELLPCRGINAVSELLTARRRGGDEKFVRPAGL